MRRSSNRGCDIRDACSFCPASLSSRRPMSVLCDTRRKDKGGRSLSRPSGFWPLASGLSGLNDFLHLILPLVLRLNTLDHPLRCVLSLELRVKELLHLHRDVLLIGAALRIVDVVVVVDQVRFLA